MKKLMTALLALSFLTATVSVGFAQDTAKKKSKKKSGSKKKKGAAPMTPKKDGGTK